MSGAFHAVCSLLFPYGTWLTPEALFIQSLLLWQSCSPGTFGHMVCNLPKVIRLVKVRNKLQPPDGREVMEGDDREVMDIPMSLSSLLNPSLSFPPPPLVSPSLLCHPLPIFPSFVTPPSPSLLCHPLPHPSPSFPPLSPPPSTPPSLSPSLLLHPPLSLSLYLFSSVPLHPSAAVLPAPSLLVSSPSVSLPSLPGLAAW